MGIRGVVFGAIIVTFFSVVFTAEDSQGKPFVIKLAIPAPKDSGGGIITADINNDGETDYLVTVPGHLAVYDNNGKKLWIKKTDILYVADVTGDWREEIIVLNGSELHIYANSEVNPRPKQKRLWTNRNYRRLKQCYNYYSP